MYTHRAQQLLYSFEKATRCNWSLTSCLSPSGCKSSPTAAPLSSCLKLSHGAAPLASLQSSVTPGSTVSLLCVCTSPSHPLMALLWDCKHEGSGLSIKMTRRVWRSSWTGGCWTLRNEDSSAVFFCFFFNIHLFVLLCERLQQTDRVNSVKCKVLDVVFELFFFFLQTGDGVRCCNNKIIHDSWTRKCRILGVKLRSYNALNPHLHATHGW